MGRGFEEGSDEEEPKEEQRNWIAKEAGNAWGALMDGLLPETPDTAIDELRRQCIDGMPPYDGMELAREMEEPEEGEVDLFDEDRMVSLYHNMREGSAEWYAEQAAIHRAHRAQKEKERAALAAGIDPVTGESLPEKPQDFDFDPNAPLGIVGAPEITATREIPVLPEIFPNTQSPLQQTINKVAQACGWTPRNLNVTQWDLLNYGVQGYVLSPHPGVQIFLGYHDHRGEYRVADHAHNNKQLLAWTDDVGAVVRTIQAAISE